MSNDQITSRQILSVVTILSLAFLVLVGFQMSQLLRDRQALQQAFAQQERPVAEAERLQNQLGALITGTEKLATEGNVNAKELMAKLNKIGVSTAPAKPEQAPAAPAQAAPAAPAAPAAKK